MGRNLYLECYSGISGDMAVAALLDLGADQEVLMRALNSLPVRGFRINISRVTKSGIDACDFDVVLDAAHENHDHDMEYLHGHGHPHSHDGQEHTHGHHHEHRGMNEIRQIIAKADMTEGARALAEKIFAILARAEAKAHHVPEEEVHFHEVGAVDSIADIIAAAVCLDDLQVTEVIVPVLCEGRGTVRCQHGILPVPVPAVANIIEAYRLPVQIVDAEGEFVTPTGAAIAAAVKTSQKLPKEFSIEKIGIGAGKRNYDRPGILRAMLIRDQTEEKDVIWKLETNIDDCSGEIFGFVMEQLFAAGARDVHYTPVFMKKNRPAWQLNVICKEEDIPKLEEIIFRETTTIGIRRTRMERTVLKRYPKEIATPFGNAKVKVCQGKGETRFYPEYESVAELARARQAPYCEVYQTVMECCKKESR